MGDIGEGERIQCSELKRTEEPSHQQDAKHRRHRRCRRESGAAQYPCSGENRVDHQHTPVSPVPENRRRRKFHQHGADRADEGDEACGNRRKAEPHLKQHREQEGGGADREAAEVSGQRRDLEARDVQ